MRLRGRRSAAGAGPGGRSPSPVRVDDARLLRRVRRQLVAFSAASMLVVVLVLGGALYAAVAHQLGASGADQLEGRADRMTDVLQRGGRAQSGFDIGGPGSGTLAVIVAPMGQMVGLPGQGFVNAEEVFAALPEQGGLRAVAGGGQDLREVTIAGTAFRVLTRRVTLPLGAYTVQVLQDRTAEQRTLDVLLLVLGLGGLGAVAVSAVAGSRYAARALVPIRESLRRQREFAADASHELRTPLAVLRGGLEHLRRHPDASIASQGETLDDLAAEVGHVTSLVDDLLLLARADSGALDLARQPTDLAEVAADALAPLTHLARDRGAELALDPEPAPILGDAVRLRQVVTILVDNALRHGRVGGHVALQVRREDRQAVLRVDDDGPGISPADLGHVFDRFWRSAGDAGEGSGLGLAIAVSIIAGHGGVISAENRPEGGARFTVRLPLAGN